MGTRCDKGFGSAGGVLIADDDPHFLRLLEHHLRSWSHSVRTASDRDGLLRGLRTARPELVLLDVRFGDHDGVDMLREIAAEHPGLRVVMLTAFGSIDDATRAMKHGAIDYLTKPVDLQRLRGVVGAAPEVRDRGQATAAAATPPLSRPILGGSAAVGKLLAELQRAAATDATVLILGESGTGKELVARALHELGPRRSGPFIAANVAALPRELVDSMLFGHAKGAFTGADQAQRGFCESADKGTLFLDEIGEMEVGLQAKLLRFLQERSFQRVGQSEAVGVDVRVVAATNRNPVEQVRRGLMREDLFYRLNVLPILMPPLRARREDVPLLARHFLARVCQRCGRDEPVLTPDAVAELARHDWPGNVRELEHCIERLAILSGGGPIGAAEVRSDITRLQHAFPAAAPAGEMNGHGNIGLTSMERLEKAALIEALAATNGRVREAAARLGLGQATVYRKIKKYQLDER